MSDTALPSAIPAAVDPPDEWRRTDPLTFVASALTTLPNILFALVAVMFGTEIGGRGMLVVVPIILAVLGFSLLAAWLAWIRLRYRLGETDIRLEQGLISRSARSVPYERIQDVSLEEKLVPRLLGLVEVRFETGAGGKDELKLSYVSREEGERLRETVRALRDEVQDAPVAGLGAVAPAVREETSELLFAMGPDRLVTFGLFEFSLVIFAVLIGAAQQFDFLLPFDLWDMVEAQFSDDRITNAGSYISTMGVTAQVLGVLYALLVIVVVGVGSGIVRTLLRDWDFRLERTAKGFRRRRGLLTRTDVVMPAHRVQALSLTTGFVRRLFGWHGLSFVSLAQDSGSANHDVAPFAKLEEIAPIARAAGFDLPDATTQWHRPSVNYRFDKALLQLLAVVPVGIALAIAFPTVWPAVLAIVAAGFLALRQMFLLRYERFALSARQVMERTGWLAPRVTVADRIKLHSVEISRGPIAQRRGYAHLVFGLAGGSFALRGLRLDDARALRAAMLDSIARVDFSDLPR